MGLRLMLLGPPGAGKGTQARLLASHFHIVQISTGDILRRAIREKTPLGLRVEKVLGSGGLVSDDIMIDLVKARVQEPDCRAGFLLDGFPRTLAQVEGMSREHIALDHVINIDVPDEEIISRVSGRRMHPPSGRTYHDKFNPPKNAGVDDVTGEPLVQREDDSEKTVRNRLRVYREQTQPLLTYYQQWMQSGDTKAPRYHCVNGVGSPDVVQKRILQLW